jgi:hypothetical protein
MRKTGIALVLGLMLLGVGIASSGTTAARMRVTVPFAFYAGNELLPAGSYVFEIGAITSTEASGSAVFVHDETGSIAAWLLTMPGDAPLSAAAQLQFNRYGDKYYLATVGALGYKASLKTTKSEKEMRAQNRQKRESTIVTAN